MSTLYTAYGLKLDDSSAIRPCGMNNLVHLDSKKAPTKLQQRATCERAAKQGYDTVAFYADEKLVRLIELW